MTRKIGDNWEGGSRIFKVGKNLAQAVSEREKSKNISALRF